MEGERGWEDCIPQFTPRERAGGNGRRRMRETERVERITRGRLRHGWVRELICCEGFWKRGEERRKKQQGRKNVGASVCMYVCNICM